MGKYFAIPLNSKRAPTTKDEISTGEIALLTPGNCKMKVRKYGLAEPQTSDKRAGMDTDLIYWAAVATHDELVGACRTQANLLTTAGFQVSFCQNSAGADFSSEVLGSFSLQVTDVYGSLAAEAANALAATLLLGAATRDPLLILLATGDGRPCTNAMKREFVQHVLTPLEKTSQQRIMAISGLLPITSIYRITQNVTDNQFQNFVNSNAI